MIDLQFAKKSFDSYVGQYDVNNENIKRKYYHTYRVCKQSIEICKSLHLTQEETDLAYLIALLHDIGRFEQFKVYGTFSDIKSCDHALLGCEILFDEGLIRNFILDNKYDNVIKRAVYNHNKLEIEKGLNDIEMMYSKIIRDADKIDIIYNIVCQDEIKFGEDDNDISDKIINDFRQFKCLSNKDVKSKNDAIMIRLSFVFDLNYKYSFLYFMENKFLDKFYSKIKCKQRFLKYVKLAETFLEGKCK